MPSGKSIDFRFFEKTGAATKAPTMEHHTPCQINTAQMMPRDRTTIWFGQKTNNTAKFSILNKKRNSQFLDEIWMKRAN